MTAYVPEDHTQAASLYQSAAKQGYAEAQFQLGYLYERGKGVTQDDVQAAAWTRKAAEQGHADAQFQLGYLYNSGRGVPQDEVQAASWMRKAAEQGDATAQYLVGLLYLNGWGVPEDYAEAIVWFREAAKQGHAEALKYVDVNDNARAQRTAEQLPLAAKAATTNAPGSPSEQVPSSSLEHVRKNRTGVETSPADKPVPQDGSERDSASELTFTRGSREDDVLRLQGTPTNIRRYPSLGHEDWSFGSSTVQISTKTRQVTEWNNRDRNLKVRLGPET